MGKLRCRDIFRLPLWCSLCSLWYRVGADCYGKNTGKCLAMEVGPQSGVHTARSFKATGLEFTSGRGHFLHSSLMQFRLYVTMYFI